jgi:chlorite dismutase
MNQGSEIQIDLHERGINRDGTKQTLNARLFMQLQVFGGCTDTTKLVNEIKQSELEGVFYRDANDPRGVAILAVHEDPAFFVTTLRDLLNTEPFGALTQKPEHTMLGRTYSTGYEQDLEDWLLRKPRRTAFNPAWPWAVWYPLRRTGAFAKLPHQEQGTILREHALIGRAYGEADLAHDIRLACHGLDARDNEFIIGLIGRELYPLSHVIQSMRKTRQTAEYIQSMGPFFVGHVIWQSPCP